jgi:hypothetical protein
LCTYARRLYGSGVGGGGGGLHQIFCALRRSGCRSLGRRFQVRGSVAHLVCFLRDI